MTSTLVRFRENVKADGLMIVSVYAHTDDVKKKSLAKAMLAAGQEKG